MSPKKESPSARTSPHPPQKEEPKLRSDARDNRAKLLQAARRLFDKQGVGVGIDEVAREAGVGVGTLYRHFPTKEALFAATVVSHMEELVKYALAAVALPDIDEAFFGFLARLMELGRKKKNLADALAKQGAEMSFVNSDLSGQLREAVEALLARAQDAGVVREGIRVGEVMALVRGTFAALEPGADEASRLRVFAVLCDGLRAPASAKRKPRR